MRVPHGAHRRMAGYGPIAHTLCRPGRGGRAWFNNAGLCAGWRNDHAPGSGRPNAPLIPGPIGLDPGPRARGPPGVLSCRPGLLRTGVASSLPITCSCDDLFLRRFVSMALCSPLPCPVWPLLIMMIVCSRVRSRSEFETRDPLLRSAGFLRGLRSMARHILQLLVPSVCRDRHCALLRLGRSASISMESQICPPLYISGLGQSNTRPVDLNGTLVGFGSLHVDWHVSEGGGDGIDPPPPFLGGNLFATCW